MRVSVQALQEKLSRAAKQSLDRKFGALYDKLYRSDVLQEAWTRARANKGAAGIDEHSIACIGTVIRVDAFFWPRSARSCMPRATDRSR